MSKHVDNMSKSVFLLPSHKTAAQRTNIDQREDQSGSMPLSSTESHSSVRRKKMSNIKSYTTLTYVLFFVLAIVVIRYLFNTQRLERTIAAKPDDHIVARNYQHHHTPIDIELDTHHLSGNIDIPNINGEFFEQIETILVIPGGGSSNEIGGYPEWTKRRVKDAFAYYESLSAAEQKKTLFLPLSAGSLNNPNVLLPDKRVQFECQPMIQHLQQLGVPKEHIYGDIFSWDTVTNGLSLRLFVEGLLLYRKAYAQKNNIPYPGKPISSSSPPSSPASSSSLSEGKPLVELLVFISDFHANRVKASFQWILGLQPSLLGYSLSDLNASPTTTTVMELMIDPLNPTEIRTTEEVKGVVNLRIFSVDSRGIEWGSAADYQSRIEHEKKGYELILAQAKLVHTREEYYAFLMLGGHLGIRKYLFQEYARSKGAGWR